MEHSIAAKYAARPAAHFPRALARTRERRLGLGSAVAFRASSGRATVLRLDSAPALSAIRHGSRAITPTRPRNPMSGRPRPSVAMSWSRSVPSGRFSAVTAPWRA